MNREQNTNKNKKALHSKPNVSALEWWNIISFETKFFSTIEWLSHNNRDTTEKNPKYLTNREIQEIYELLH